jgi:hypothetical protein
LLLGNALEYADRSLTFGVVLLLLLWLISRKRPQLEPTERLWIARGLILAVGSFGVTFFLPVRSSLYVCLPAAGTALVFAALATALWRGLSQREHSRLLLAGLLLPIFLVPVYRARARRWVAPADVSHTVLTELAQSPAFAGVTVIHDATETRATVAGAFGTLVQEAVALATGVSPPRVWIDPPPPLWESAGLKPPQPGEKVRYFTLRDGQLVPEPDRTIGTSMHGEGDGTASVSRLRSPRLPQRSSLLAVTKPSRTCVASTSVASTAFLPRTSSVSRKPYVSESFASVASSFARASSGRIGSVAAGS